MATTKIEEAYARSFPRSAAAADRARRVCPGGVSQVFREIKPFPPCYDRGEGPRKWTIDDRELVDYCMGHGALIFGHGDPEIAQAASEQLARGTHFANVTNAELELAELVCELVPSADRVRFTGTGSEACLLALRIARAATGKDKFIKFEGHYHGWHDPLFVALRPPYERPLTAGVPQSVRDNCVVLPPNDTAAVERALAEHDDIGCVMVEAAGGLHGTVPTSQAWVADLRRLTREHSIPLVFDEMVSGFRLSPGGYQGWSGITPDLTTLGKALYGGFPGGAVAGSAELMELTRAGADSFAAHYGTFNAFPVSCAAGVATLRRLRDGSVQDQINELGRQIRAALNQVIAEKGVHARVYGTGSHIHFLLRAWPFEGDSEVPPPGRHGELAADPNQQRLFRIAMLVSGIDVAFGNNISAVHGETEAEALREGFAAALELLIEDELIATL